MKTVRPKSKQGNTTNLNISFSMENEKGAAQVGFKLTTYCLRGRCSNNCQLSYRGSSAGWVESWQYKPRVTCLTKLDKQAHSTSMQRCFQLEIKLLHFNHIVPRIYTLVLFIIIFLGMHTCTSFFFSIVNLCSCIIFCTKKNMPSWIHKGI